MFASDRSSPIPFETQPKNLNEDLTNEFNETTTTTTTPELNILLDKLTEILRIRSVCQRHCHPVRRNFSTNNNLKRLKTKIIEPFDQNYELSKTKSDLKSRLSNRSSHQNSMKLFVNEKKRRFPCLLQSLIDDGNLIKEAVRRLKSQGISRNFHQTTNDFLDSPTTPNQKSSSSISIPSSQSCSSELNNQIGSSPTLPFSWFLSSNVFGSNNQNSENDSPIRPWMEIGIQDR